MIGTRRWKMITTQIQDALSRDCPVSTPDRNPSIGDRRASGGHSSDRSIVSIDVLAVCTNPELSIYLSGVLQPFRWTVEEVRSVAEARDMLCSRPAAVVVCESALRDGSWTDLADHLRLLPMAPELIVVEDDNVPAGEVEALGGFGTISRPLREADVIWTLASAWHMWMNGAEAGQASGGATCSGG
jgi:hypothetical protein